MGDDVEAILLVFAVMIAFVAVETPRAVRGSSGNSLPPPPTEKTSSRQDEARQASTGNGAGNARSRKSGHLMRSMKPVPDSGAKLSRTSMKKLMMLPGPENVVAPFVSMTLKPPCPTTDALERPLALRVTTKSARAICKIMHLTPR